MSRLAGTLIWVAVMSGCSVGGPIEVPADPLTATGTLDTPRAVSKKFGWRSGGELSVTTVDGVVFHLRVPDTALVEDTTITMTPFASLTTPLGETSYGVQFEPAGLFPTEFLELTITPPAGQTWPLDEQVPFSLAGPKNVVSLALVDASAEVTLRLSHFSSYGLALAKKGFSASLEASRHRLGGDVEAQLENTLGEHLANERRAVLLSEEGGGNLVDLMSDFTKRYIEQVIKPRLAAAKDSCANARLAAQTTLGFLRMMDLIGADTSSLGFTFSYDELFTNSTVCMKEEYELCRDNHILTRIIPAYLGVLRMAALLGYDLQSNGSVAKIQSERYLGKCLKFDIELTSSVRYSTGSGIDSYNVDESMHLPHARAAYVVTTEELGDGLPASLLTGAVITGTPSDFSVSGYRAVYANNCVNTTTSPGPGQMAMIGVGFEAMEGDLVSRAHVKDFMLALSLSPNSSSYSLSQRSRESNGSCSGTPTVDTVHENWSTLGFAPWLGSLDVASADAYVKGWTIVGGDIIATKDVSWNSGQGAAFTANFILRHTPDPE